MVNRWSNLRALLYASVIRKNWSIRRERRCVFPAIPLTGLSPRQVNDVIEEYAKIIKYHFGEITVRLVAGSAFSTHHIRPTGCFLAVGSRAFCFVYATSGEDHQFRASHQVVPYKRAFSSIALSMCVLAAGDARRRARQDLILCWYSSRFPGENSSSANIAATALGWRHLSAPALAFLSWRCKASTTKLHGGNNALFMAMTARHRNLRFNSSRPVVASRPITQPLQDRLRTLSMAVSPQR